VDCREGGFAESEATGLKACETPVRGPASSIAVGAPSGPRRLLGGAATSARSGHYGDAGDGAGSLERHDLLRVRQAGIHAAEPDPGAQSCKPDASPAVATAARPVWQELPSERPREGGVHGLGSEREGRMRRGANETPVASAEATGALRIEARSRGPRTSLHNQANRESNLGASSNRDRSDSQTVGFCLTGEKRRTAYGDAA